MFWFSGCTTTDEIKARYRTLVFEHHPDRGGETAVMQEINAEYHKVLEGQHGQQQPMDDGAERTYYYHEQRETAAADKLSALVKLNLPETIEIWLIGSWIWVWGDTKPHREALKAEKLRWHGKRHAWYWHAPSKRRHRYNDKASLEDLAGAYGAFSPSRQSAEDEPRQLAAAG